jgi:hypothetical protein
VTPHPAFTETPVPTFLPTVTPGTLHIATLGSLKSYRLEAQTVLEGGTLGTERLTQNFLQEWDYEFDAYHIIADAVKNESSAPAIPPGQFSSDAAESMQIEKTSWVKTKDGWLQFDVQQPQMQRIGGVDLPTDWQSLQPVGEEMVAGIHCTHYKVDETIVDMSMSNAMFNGVHAQGDLWVASQTDIPAVILRVNLNMSVSKPFFYAFLFLPPDWASPTPKAGEQPQEVPGIFHYEYEVKEANSPITIEPPPPAAPGQQY